PYETGVLGEPGTATAGDEVRRRHVVAEEVDAVEAGLGHLQGHGRPGELVDAGRFTANADQWPDVLPPGRARPGDRVGGACVGLRDRRRVVGAGVVVEEDLDLGREVEVVVLAKGRSKALRR